MGLFNLGVTTGLERKLNLMEAHRLTVIVVGKGHGDTSPGWGCLFHFHANALRKGMNPPTLSCHS